MSTAVCAMSGASKWQAAVNRSESTLCEARGATEAGIAGAGPACGSRPRGLSRGSGRLLRFFFSSHASTSNDYTVS